MISDERILVTGVTGTIGTALALHLARRQRRVGHRPLRGRRHPGQGDVHRRRDTTADAARSPPREELEAAGVTVRAVDLAVGDFGDLPDDFTYVVHLAWLRADLDHLEDALAPTSKAPASCSSTAARRRPRS